LDKLVSEKLAGDSTKEEEEEMGNRNNVFLVGWTQAELG